MRIFENAEFISCEDDNKIFNVLIEDKGKIVFTGDKNAIPKAFSHGEPIDLKKRYVVPAFGDTHIHFASFAHFNAGLDCRDVENFDALSEIIHRHIANNPREKTTLAFGCSAHSVQEKRLPNKDDLDKITSHPIMIVKYDGHASVGNSAMIQKLPANVLKERGFNKQTGWFYQESFYKAVNHISKSVSLPQLFTNLIGGSDFLARNGIALVHTSEGVGYPLDLDVDAMRFAALGLPQEYRIYFQTLDVRKVLKRKLNCIGGCFATALDGCLGSEDAALKKPYTNNPANSGVLFYSQDEVNRFTNTAHQKGLQIAFHAIGDAAIYQALTAFEQALKAFPRKDHRHLLIHADLMDKKSIEKASELGIAMAVQTPFLYWKQEPMSYLESILGERAYAMIPLKTMLDAGLLIANGSDGPCTRPNPILGIYAACNHPNPDERISALDALKMHTSWCAKLSFDENERGTLATGKTADFAVLDKNPLTIPVESIKEIKIDALYLSGEKYMGQDRSAGKLFLRCLKNKFF